MNISTVHPSHRPFTISRMSSGRVHPNVDHHVHQATAQHGIPNVPAHVPENGRGLQTMCQESDQ